MFSKLAPILTVGCTVFFVLPASIALAAPDVTDTATISSDTAGAWTATKRVDVFNEGHPDDPFPGDGLNTYVYTVANDPGSVIALGGFLLATAANETPECLPATIGFIPGPNDPVVSTLNVTMTSTRAEWYFDPQIAPGTSSSQLYLTSTCGPGTMPDQLKESSIAGLFGLDGNGLCLAPVVPPVVVGEAMPCTIGFWKNRAAGKKGTLQHFSDVEFDAIVTLAVALSDGVFADEAALLSDLQSKGNRPADQRARQQLAAFLLNLAAGDLYPDNQKCKLFEGNLLSATGNECGAPPAVSDVGDALDEFFAEYDAGMFIDAKDCADDVNNGIGIP